MRLLWLAEARLLLLLGQKPPHPILGLLYLQKTVAQILASTEVFTRFETILEVSLGKGVPPSWTSRPQQLMAPESAHPPS